MTLPDLGELLPCPFCGGDAKTLTRTDQHGTWLSVFCDREGCANPETHAMLDGKAIAQWNRRSRSRREWRPDGDAEKAAALAVGDVELGPSADPDEMLSLFDLVPEEWCAPDRLSVVQNISERIAFAAVAAWLRVHYPPRDLLAEAFAKASPPSKTE